MSLPPAWRQYSFNASPALAPSWYPCLHPSSSFLINKCVRFTDGLPIQPPEFGGIRNWGPPTPPWSGEAGDAPAVQNGWRSGRQ